KMNTESEPKLYLSTPHRCPYLAGKTASTLLLDPARRVDAALFGALLKAGFRRSGASIYRPHCGNCQACVSVRVPAREYRPNRAQRRAIARNRDVRSEIKPAAFAREHFELYCRYQSWRHRGDLMDHSDPAQYRESMVRSSVETVFMEHRLNGKLAAVSVCDLPEDGMSAVYTFFEPELHARSLGTFAITRQIEYVRGMDLEWLYLGHWVRGCAKMDYKINFRPIFGFVRGEWQLLRM
ncbi:MAG: arginyltransferase, partial [Gammaproteobacteria bacterium]|nr:arginyltransferase [Gammaproteobacteria bacterium]